MTTRLTLGALVALALCLVVGQLAWALTDCNGNPFKRTLKDKVLNSKPEKDRRRFIGIGTKLADINEHLTRTIDSEDLDENIAELVEFERELQVGARAGRTLANVRAIIDAKDISRIPDCSDVEFEKLDSLDELLDRKPSRLHKIESHCRRRVELLVRQIFSDYARRCAIPFKNMIKERVAKIVESSGMAFTSPLKTVVRETSISFAKNLATFGFNKHKLYPEDANSVIDSILSANSLLDEDNLTGVLATIKEFALQKGDLPKDAREVSLDKMKDLLRRYVLDGCRRFVPAIEKISKMNLFVYLTYPEGISLEDDSVARVISAWTFCRIALKEGEQIASAMVSRWTNPLKLSE